jgi:hypothetical protein
MDCGDFLASNRQPSLGNPARYSPGMDGSEGTNYLVALGGSSRKSAVNCSSSLDSVWISISKWVCGKLGGLQ